MHINLYIIREEITYKEAIENEDFISEQEFVLNHWIERGHGDYGYSEDARVVPMSELNLEEIAAFVTVTTDDFVDLEKEMFHEIYGVMGDYIREQGGDPEKIWGAYTKKTLGDIPADTAVVIYPYHN